MSEAAANSSNDRPEEDDANIVSPSEVDDKSDVKNSSRPPNRDRNEFPAKINKDCWYYLNGQCRYGRNCMYRHPRFSKPNYRNYRPDYSRGNQTNNYDYSRGNQTNNYDYSRGDQTNNYQPRSRGYRNYSDRFNNRNDYPVRNASRAKYTNGPAEVVEKAKYYNGETQPKPRRYRVFTNSNRYAQQNDIASPPESPQASDFKVFQSQKHNHAGTSTSGHYKQPVNHNHTGTSTSGHYKQPVNHHNGTEGRAPVNRPNQTVTTHAPENSKQPVNQLNRTVMNPRQPVLLSSATKEDIARLRQTEITQLKKRYPDLEAEQGTEDIFVICFSSSDPDWAFDLRSLMLEISLPIEYPKEPCVIEVLEDEQMPPMLQKYLNHCLNDWIIDRYKTMLVAGEAELVLRPFFRWLDRNLEELFIEGLRKVKLDVEAKRAGIDFVPFESLPGSSISSKTNGSSTDEQKENIEHQNGEPLATENNKENEETEENVEECTGEEEPIKRQAAGPSNYKSSGKKGTEIKLQNFELKDGATALQCQKLAVTVRCTRCKTFNDITSLTKQKHHSTACPKCHQLQEADFQPSLMHAFSSVMGYLHLVGCQAGDLPMAQCSFYLDCFNCNKQNITDGIHYGQNHSMWCYFCNKKLSVSAQSAKFTLLQPIEKQTTKITSTSKKLKEPLIEVGKPLPNNGICKHYKKSYRWLRFPCCGKAYACDLCHNENETDHEMKYATRMICGLCAKEQIYSRGQPCVHCSSMLTKKATPHWEGGKGCRDRIKMCREDKQKYAGMNKTVSKRANGLQPKKSRA